MTCLTPVNGEPCNKQFTHLADYCDPCFFAWDPDYQPDKPTRRKLTLQDFANLGDKL